MTLNALYALSLLEYSANHIYTALEVLMPKEQPTIESPCVRNCCLDSEDFCMGCGRHIEEILRWQQVSDEERNAILERATTRRLKFRSAIDKR